MILKFRVNGCLGFVLKVAVGCCTLLHVNLSSRNYTCPSAREPNPKLSAPQLTKPQHVQPSRKPTLSSGFRVKCLSFRVWGSRVYVTVITQNPKP